MIPAPLAVGLDVRPRPPIPRTRVLTGAGIAALALAVVGAVVWAAGLSPLGYQRGDVFDTTRRMTFRQAGEYVVYEEFEGASEPSLPLPLEVIVRDERGRSLEVTTAQQPGERSAPDPYRTPWHEGRALARFEVDEPGSYLLELRFLTGERGRYRPFEQVTIAVGRQVSWDWFAGPWGLAVLSGVPAGIGLGLLGAGRLGRRRERRAGPG